MDGELDARFGARLFRPNFEKRPRNLLSIPVVQSGTRNPVISPTCPGVSAARRAAAQEPLYSMLYTTTGGGEVQACPAVSVVTCRGVAR